MDGILNLFVWKICLHSIKLLCTHCSRPEHGNIAIVLWDSRHRPSSVPNILFFVHTRFNSTAHAKYPISVPVWVLSKMRIDHNLWALFARLHKRTVNFVRDFSIAIKCIRSATHFSLNLCYAVCKF